MKTPLIAIISITITLTAACACRAAYSPIALAPGSYNADIVVEKTAPQPLIQGGYTTASMDGGIANNGTTWVEAGFFTNAAPLVVPGLPPAGTLLTNQAGDHIFKLPPSYVMSNNAILLDSTYFTNVYALHLSTQGVYSALSFLGGGGNGGATFQWTAYHADGTTETNTLSSQDWFSGQGSAVFYPGGRVNAQTLGIDQYTNANGPCLYAWDAYLNDTSSAVTNITLQFVSGGNTEHTCIMAVSGMDATTGLFNPITFSGYNADMVVEASAGPATDAGNLAAAPLRKYTTASMDSGTNNTGNTWYEQGYTTYYPQSGLPPAGSILVSANLPDHSYQLAPSYTQPNAIFVDSNGPVAQLTFATPASYSVLSFLYADGLGPVTVQVAIDHQDGSTETNSFTSLDWFGGVPAAFTANGRVDLDNGILNNLNSGNPRLYEEQIVLANTTSPVTGATLYWTANNGPSPASRFVVFAVSGTTVPIAPVITDQPVSVTVAAGSGVSFTALATGTLPLAHQWQAAAPGGTFTNLADSEDVSGALTATLSLDAVTVASDGVSFRVVITNTAGSVTSQAATLAIYSALANMAKPGDSIVNYPANTTSPAAQGPAYAIDGTTLNWLNSGLNGGAPYLGPAGCIWTPSAGSTILSGIRIFSGNDNPQNNPANFILEGSTDGTHFSLITSNLIAVPDARNAGFFPIDVTSMAFAERDFNNTTAYTVYRFTVTMVENPTLADGLQVGEIQFLGVSGTSTAAPVMTLTRGTTPGTFTIASSEPAELYSSTNLSSGNWVDEGPITGSIKLTVNPGTPQMYYRLGLPGH